MHLRLLLILLFICSVSIAERKLEFNRDIRPILSDACFHCHGPDEKERKGGLRLDLKSYAYKAGKSGLEAIIGGNADESEIISRIHLPEMILNTCPPLRVVKSLPMNKRRF